jgi:ADP-ribose pyrophosphatase YjhB (NUDIX family)
VSGPAYPHEVLAVVLRVRAARLQVLLWQRAAEPHAGRWALPGGALDADERLGTAAARHLAAKVDVREIAHLEQLETRSDPQRDPRRRVLATAYLGLVPAGAEPELPADTAWHPVDDLPETAFDHGSIADAGRLRLQAKLSYTTIGFALAPETFTISQLREIYGAVLGHDVSATNLQRVLLRRGVLQRTTSTASPTHAGGRPASVYRFRERQVLVTDPFPAFRPRGISGG